MSDTAIGRLRFGARSERHTRPTAAEHSFGSCLGRAFFYRMLSDGQICLIPYTNIRPKLRYFQDISFREHSRTSG